jgi:cytidine deaminase
MGESDRGTAGPAHPRAADELLRAARAAAELAYAPYSGVHVGAALLGRDGVVYSGCNVENASFGLTICAERSAALRAVSSGERRFVALAIATNRPHAVMPCGACRQVLAEFAPDLEVIVQGTEGAPERTTLTELLPRAFGAGDLGPSHPGR